MGGDFAYTGTTGAKPFGTDMSNRYNDQVVIAGQRDDAVVVRFNEVTSLMRRPESLLASWFVARVPYSAWRMRRSRTARSTPLPSLPPREAPRQLPGSHEAGIGAEFADAGVPATGGAHAGETEWTNARSPNNQAVIKLL